MMMMRSCHVCTRVPVRACNQTMVHIKRNIRVLHIQRTLHVCTIIYCLLVWVGCWLFAVIFYFRIITTT